MAEHNDTGRWGEEQAARYLAAKGYRIIARNWHNDGRKELDIVALDGNILVFVEVKTRAEDSLTTPLSAVNHEKMHRLTLAASSFVRTHHLGMPYRFDVIGIQGADLEHVEDAFTPC